MKSPHVLKELSAYIDGEARDPDRIARHLQSCPDCARRHLDLLKIAYQIRGLEGPAVSAGFEGRVVARAAEPQEREISWLWAGDHPLVACAAIFAVIAGVAAFNTMRADAPPRIGAELAPALNPAWREDEPVVAALAHLLETGAPTDLFAAFEGLEDELPDGGDVPLEEVLDMLAEGAIGGGGAEEAYAGFGAPLDDLVELDRRVLADMLEEYRGEV